MFLIAMSLFDHCATCKSCCHVDVGAPPLEVHLTSTERRFMQPICIKRRCKNLAAAGCTLGNSKPFGCDLYPLAYDPASKQFFLDSECPLAKRYADQLSAPDSDASRHLSRMAATIHGLERTDFEYLESNFAFDQDYFSLTPLNRTPD